VVLSEAAAQLRGKRGKLLNTLYGQRRGLTVSVRRDQSDTNMRILSICSNIPGELPKFDDIAELSLLLPRQDAYDDMS